MRRPLYRAAIETEKCAVGVLLNGCPCFHSDGSSRLQSTIMLNLWANAGRNTLQIQLEPAGDASSLAGTGAVFRCKVTVHDMAEPPDSRETITLLEFELASDDDTGTYPLILERSFDAPSPFAEWTWLRSSPLRLDDSIRQEVIQILQRIWDALNRKDMDTVMSMQPVRIREMAQALFSRTDAVAEDIRDQLARVVTNPSCSLMPFDPDTIQFRLHAEDRLISVHEPQEDYVIRYELPDDLITGLLLYFTRNEHGRLVWIR